MYKNDVPIPPLSMVDDVLSLTECGYQTAKMTSFLKCKMSTKKLQFGINKCKRLHIGKTHFDVSKFMWINGKKVNIRIMKLE